MKFSARYDKFIELCRGKIPEIQVQGLNECPKINPIITPTPRDWFVDSFDWYVALKLIRGKVYGPFYRIDGDFFWPTIGNMYDVYSETKCFFGLEKPEKLDDGRLLFNIREDTSSDLN